jgi:hypothetical protein
MQIGTRVRIVNPHVIGGGLEGTVVEIDTRLIRVAEGLTHRVLLDSNPFPDEEDDRLWWYSRDEIEIIDTE